MRALKLAKKAQSQCVPSVENLTVFIPPVGNITLSPDASFDDSETLVDSEDSIEATPRKLLPVSFGEKAIPRLGFRVWDSNSRRSVPGTMYLPFLNLPFLKVVDSEIPYGGHFR